jgi:N-methylhydantoinase A
MELPEGEVARGMVEVVEAHMERALRVVSIEQGFDTRGASLLAFGGAAGLHAAALARRLDMDQVLIPPHAGVFSALGLLLSAPRTDVSRSVMMQGEGLALDAVAVELMNVAAAGLRQSTGRLDVELGLMVDVRYLGQSHEIGVPYRAGLGWAQLASDFHAAHLRINGFARDADPIEVVTIRATAVADPLLQWDHLPVPAPAGERRLGTRSVPAAGEVPVWWRPALAAGDEVLGPAFIDEPEATTIVGHGDRAVVMADGTIRVEW